MKDKILSTTDKSMTISDFEKLTEGMKFGEEFLVYDNLSPLSKISGMFTFNFGGVVFMSKGTISVEINDNNITASEKEFLLFRQGDKWNISELTEDCSGWIICTSVSLILENKEYTGFSRMASVLGEERLFSNSNEGVYDIVEMYGTILKTKFKNGIKDVRLTLAALIDDILNCSSVSVKNKKLRRKPAGKVFKMFTTLLVETNPKPRSVKWYSDTLSVSPGHLTRVSKQVSGKTVTEWIDEAIMADIRRLLLYSECNVKEIALKAGFNNEAFFCQYVKKHAGMTPLQYREKLQN